MACSGAHCTNHDTGTTTCVGHRPTCATNRPFNPSAAFGVVGGSIKQSDVDVLRRKIDNECDRYNDHSLWNVTLLEPSSWAVGTAADSDHPENLRQMMIDIDGGLANLKAPLDPILANDWLNMIANKYENVRTDCICNSDCSCNAICACHNDCGCNYSDETIKTNIAYL